jgi:matrix metalloproteinase-14 (membrane-inserted)
MFMEIVKQVLVLSVLATHAQPIDESFSQETADKTFSANYLNNFGYLAASGSSETSSLQSIDNAINMFQAFAGLAQTGELNDETFEMMNKRRCGVRDIGDDNDLVNQTGLITLSRKKRFALQGSWWKTRTLTYRVTEYPSKNGLSRSDADLTMKKAFDVWARATNLKFEREI